MRKYNNFIRIGRIHSHVKNISILGFKGLFLARIDGKTQTILDFSLHGEDAKHRDSLTGDEAAFAQGLQGIAPAIMPGYHAKAGRTAVGTVQLVIVGKGNHLRLFVFWILVEPVCYAEHGVSGHGDSPRLGAPLPIDDVSSV